MPPEAIAAAGIVAFTILMVVIIRIVSAQGRPGQEWGKRDWSKRTNSAPRKGEP